MKLHLSMMVNEANQERERFADITTATQPIPR
jgi:hypothetical protein